MSGCYSILENNCPKVYDFGCFGHCEMVEIPIEIIDSIVNLSYQNTIISIDTDENGNIVLDTSKLPIGTHYFTLHDENGQNLSINATPKTDPCNDLELNEECYSIFKIKIMYKNEI